MKILLIASNRLEEPLPAFPLGVAYLAGNIDPEAHSVEVLDLMFQDDIREKVTSAIQSASPDIIGISIRNVNAGSFNPLPEIAEIVQLCRNESDARIVLGGTGFTMMPREIITHFDADLGVQGEGVVSFNRLLERLEAGTGWDDIPGLVWRNGD
ncbi:MAG: cobalamin-dependent protein, partial [bacterium]